LFFFELFKTEEKKLRYQTMGRLLLTGKADFDILTDGSQRFRKDMKN